MESPLRLLPLECTQAHSHHEQNKIQTVTVNLTQCDCLYPCPFHITSLFHALPPSPVVVTRFIPFSSFVHPGHGYTSKQTKHISCDNPANRCPLIWRRPAPFSGRGDPGYIVLLLLSTQVTAISVLYRCWTGT
jgi:hypothetical protein